MLRKKSYWKKCKSGDRMKTLIKILLGILGVSLVGIAALYLLSIWQITLIPFVTAWKIVASIGGVIVVVMLGWVCAKTFFCKSNNGDKTRGNRAHPVR